jgi:hypothetical protein
MAEIPQWWMKGLLPTSPRESRFPMAYRHPYASNPMIWRSI